MRNEFLKSFAEIKHEGTYKYFQGLFLPFRILTFKTSMGGQFLPEMVMAQCGLGVVAGVCDRSNWEDEDSGQTQRSRTSTQSSRTALVTCGVGFERPFS